MSAQIRAAVAALARLNQHLFIILRRWTRWARRGGDVALITGVAAASRTSSSQQQSGGEATAGPAGAPSLYIPARLRANSLVLPRKRKVLVLDLDETLIHSSTKRLSVDFDVRIEVIIDRQPCVFYVYRRPHSDVFLAQVSRWFEVVIFTASMEEYASPVIDWLDPKGHISRRFYRESCVYHKNFYFKNLTVIESDLSQVMIVDNSPAAYSVVPDNAIPVDSWYSDRNDQALLDLLPLLDALRYVDDVRSVLSLRSA